ncbi:MAG: hypothetical protein NC340_05270 [Ruminococcus flavefaciens]|nr:hypothetical protein [Ruminococcus flavefaciens]MCM1231060.1 hypothetical protein [Ruminococcus flavefaciens]
MNKFERFRNDFPVFIYKNCDISESNDTINVEYVFEIPGLTVFNTGWSFAKPENFTTENNLTFERLAFSLGMAEAISYWKATCSPVIRLECGELSPEQVKWWKKLYFLGLGEFCYVNGIDTDVDSFVDIQSVGKFRSTHESEHAEPTGCLIPIGGGKDSALSLEILKNSGMDYRCYSINRRNSIIGTVTSAELPEDILITSRRRFDRSLVDINNQGYLNGHTPFSAIVAFSAEITAYINHRKYIVLSNEDSANESTVAGQSVNHQYSKSFEFEQDFHSYEEKYLHTGAYYFSFLRPLAEFQIAKLFVRYPKYLPVFRSCNLGNKVSPDIWCGDCPKCLFICLILSPFLSQGELTEIFGKDLLNDTSMEEYLIELVGKSEHKPFECVGSIDEVNLAVSLAIRKYLAENTELPFVFRKYMDMGLYSPETIDSRNEKICSGFSENNLLPDEFRNILIKEMENLL